MNWTQYPDHGPDESLLGPVKGRRVLELGCGTGCNLAHLATLGAECVGVDLSPTRTAKARDRWGDLPGLTFHTAEVTAFLAGRPRAFDVVVSIFGPVWFTDPTTLLPLVRESLTPGGTFAFSHKPPRPGQEPGAVLREARAVSRWDYTGAEWAVRLAAVGFTNITAEVIDPPEGKNGGTLLVRAGR
ncbi:class I SAM-dependent methyltransferase [Streptomyces sp. NPDC001407]|uniref:class I SAM-dependent methyltransferase n=1 Tax=unclassified Streptomyces TaxID=2593676 RepID=UPI00368C6AEB